MYVENREESVESAADREGVLEIRVHGVNRQNDYSSLGKGERLPLKGSSMTDTFVVGGVPEKTTLWLFNWSRANRGLTGPLWYGALPFTFLNVAAEMGWRRGESRSGASSDAEPKRDTTVVAVSAIQGVAISCIALVWLIAILETIVGHVSPVGYDPGLASTLIVGAAAAVLVLTILARQFGLRGVGADRGRGAYSPPWVGVIHIVAILAVAAALRVYRPGQTLTTEVDFGAFLTGTGPFAYWSADSRCQVDVTEVPACFRGEDNWSVITTHPDVLSIVLVCGLALSVVLGCVLLIRAAILARSAKGRMTRGPASAVGASILVTGSWLLLSGYGAALRMGIEWVYWALYPLLALNPDWRSSIHRLAPQPHLVVSSYDLNLRTFSLANLMPAIAIAGLVLFVLVFAVCSAGKGSANEASAARPWLPDLTAPTRWTWRGFRFIHIMISRLPDRLWLIVPVTGVLWLGVIASLWLVDSELDDVSVGFTNGIPRVVDTSTWDNGLATWLLSIALVLGILAIVFALFVGRIRVVREFFDSVADVLGFFPIAWHPLAGLSYREIVVSELDKTLTDWQGPIIYSGHSQGTVIGYWYLRHVNDLGGRVRFVTSGSPLLTLYSTFFPRHFNDDQTRVVLGRTHVWANVWRLTDPIGSPLWPEVWKAKKHIRNVDAVDPIRPTQPVRWHLDYWTDPALRDLVRELADDANG
ncbi:MAG: hypothetical protein P0Y60_16720 [Candidatus Microbacterium colombiense]|nr:MAG: hypothetical protein P0Y60_16720 [Microbacterium sp.]